MTTRGWPRFSVGRIIDHLKLTFVAEKPPPSRVLTEVALNVLEEMLRFGASFGGEQSGHIIMTRLARTGDGLLTALKVLEILDA